MDNLARLAKQYRAFEHVDRSEFRRRTRVLQSMWRTEQDYPIGEHSGRTGKRLLGSRLQMPWAEETLANYLSEVTRDVVRNEVLNKRQGLV